MMPWSFTSKGFSSRVKQFLPRNHKLPIVKSQPDSPPSPAWHGEVLAERERKLASGEDTFMDWETAKQQLRAKVGRDSSRAALTKLLRFRSTRSGRFCF